MGEFVIMFLARKTGDGVWLSLVEHLVWDQGVAGSNPVTPITYINMRV